MAKTPDILCIGSVLWDIIGRTDVPMKFGYDVPGSITRIPGGVAFNIAMTIARFDLIPAVITAIGNDTDGHTLVDEAEKLGVMTDFALRSDDLSTDRYMAVESNGTLVAAMADAASLEMAGDAILAPLRDGRLGRPEAPWTGPIAVDGNVTTALLESIARDPAFSHADLRAAPASPGKATRLKALFEAPGLTLYVNRAEAELICGVHFSSSAEAALALTAAGAARAVVTDGSVQVADARGEDVLIEVPPAVEVRRVTGAGDTFMAAHMVAETRGASRAGALSRALDATAAYISRID
ncbi:MAG: kinase [Rhodobacteraceae bacterium]|nr:kinase [Paracoccaceae bacterium]